MEWAFGPAKPAFEMVKDYQVDKQLRHATEPHLKPHTSQSSKRDEERIHFVAEAMYDYDQSMSGGGYEVEVVEDYYDFAEVAINAVKQFAQQNH